MFRRLATFFVLSLFTIGCDPKAEGVGDTGSETPTSEDATTDSASASDTDTGAAFESPVDSDQDGVLDAEDCDDTNPDLGAISNDEDCDGASSDQDCDDTDSTLNQDDNDEDGYSTCDELFSYSQLPTPNSQ
jgi:hypothetical protein